MQQTNQYKLNLIEKADTFSPDPLNENAEKVEALLAAEAQARSDADAAETQARTAADAAEAKARADAVAAEAKTRADADAAEASARKSADDTEANTRAAAVAAETKARTDAIAAEAKTRADADTAETNARKSADTAEANTRAAAVTALDNRVKVLEARRIVTGWYTGSYSSLSSTSYRQINLGFQPKLVLVYNSSDGIGVAAPEVPYYSDLVVTDTGFKVTNMTTCMNFNGRKYIYLAIL